MKLRTDLLEFLTDQDILDEAVANVDRYKAEPTFSKTGKGYLRPATPIERVQEIARSEALHMRFSIPAEEAREKELHERFDAKRIRGEWFELSQDELMWLVSFLKSNGDTARSFVDFDWLGRIHFNS
jgi:hypothetical protein